MPRRAEGLTHRPLPAEKRNVHPGFPRFVARRAGAAAILVLVVASSVLVLAHMAPPADAFGTDPRVLAAERHRLGLDQPLPQQYVAWLAHAVRLDLGESLHFHRPVTTLIRERAGRTALLGVTALLIATALGIPAGIVTGSRRGGVLASATKGASVLVLSAPPLIMSLVLLLLAARTGWLPAGGVPPATAGAGWAAGVAATLRYLALPALALGLPVAATIERLQSAAIRTALEHPSLAAARARGVPARLIVWRHALRLSLGPVLAVYGIIIGSVLSGSFAVEVVLSWSGLGQLMYLALQARDLYLAAGCAAAGAVCLAAGIFVTDVAAAVLDPRIEAVS